MNKKRLYWLDIEKVIAMVAVIVDHTRGILYNNSNIQYLSFYSVSLFIIAMGYSLFRSYSNKGISIQYIIKKIIAILVPYIIASAIYLLVQSNFTIANYIDALIHFNASGPFYYIFLYIQLLIISPVIYWMATSKKTNIFINIVILLIFCYFSTNYTNILGIYGGAGRLFGSTYTICLILGMYTCRYEKHIKDRVNIKTVILSLIILLLYIVCVYKYHFVIDSKLPFGSINPPGLVQLLYAFVIFITTYIVCNYIEEKQELYLYKIYATISMLGQHTLYIFLYHWMLLPYIKTFNNSYYVVRIFSLLMLILIPILIEIILKSIKQLLLKPFTSRNNKN